MFSLLHLFKKKNTRVVGVDIGSSAIKVVQLSQKGGKPVLETYGELALGPYGGLEIGQATNPPTEKVVEALKDLLREAKVNTDQAAASIPYAASLVSIIEMPALPEKQLAQMIPIEARKYIPVALTEVFLDWSIIPRSNNTKTPAAGTTSAPVAETDAANPLQINQTVKEKVDVLLVAIHKETLARYQSIIKDAGLQSSFFEIEIFSAIRSVLDESNLNYMILDIGSASSKVYIVEQGVVRASHVINSGSQDVAAALSRGLGITLEQAEIYKRNTALIPLPKKNDALKMMANSVDELLNGANRALISYQKRYNNTISKAIVVGGGARMEGMLELAESHLQTKVVLGDPFNKTESPAFLEKILKTTGPEFAVAVGIALRRLQESQ